MNTLLMHKTLESPEIEFDSTKGYLSIEGKSIPENSAQFYEPLFNVLNEYAKNPTLLTQINFKFEYFNTSSSKCIFNIIKQLQKINQGNYKVIINWFYDEDDDEMLEIGQDYSQFVTIPFNMKMVSRN